MSQQYGPPQQPPAHSGWDPQPAQGGWEQRLAQGGWDPPPAQGGWGPPGGYPPPRFPRQRRSNRTQWIVMTGAVLAVVLIAVGVVLLVTSGDDEKEPAPVAGDTVTPAPVGTLYTPPTPSPTQPVITKGPNDQGVEVGGGIWFTPAKGWTKDPDKSRKGQNWLLPEPGRRGAIDGFFWVRQTELMGAKAFAEHLVDVESNNLQHVVIGKGGYRECPNKAIKVCYATNYSAVVPVKGKKPVVFSGFVQAFEDHNGLTTATDAALQKEVWAARKEEILTMNGSLVRSF
jgi:hypothetical protein